MRVRHLQTRFVLAGCLLIAATVGSSLWSLLTFARLNTVVNETLRESQETIDLSAELASSLEREDDALLLGLSGDREKARQDLDAERHRGDASYAQLLTLLRTGEAEERVIADDLGPRIAAYRAAGTNLLTETGKPDALGHYHREVNPLLRQAVAGCDQLREANFRSMREAGVRARDEARWGSRLVAIIAIVAVVIGAAVAVWITRSVIRPVQELTASVEAVRQGDFNRRVPETTADELGLLAAGFNRMAAALSEYRQSSLGELIAAKTTLEATLDALPDAVLVFAPDSSLVAFNPPARAILEAKGAGHAARLAELPFEDNHRGAIEAALAGRSLPPRTPDFRRTFDVRLDGRLLRFLLTAVPVPGFTPGMFGAVAVLDDVTEFARLDELRSELIGVASHELNSPLTALRMNLLMLGEGTAGLTPRQQLLFQAAVQGCEELGGTIEELLDVTRIEAGQLRLNLTPVDLGVVLVTARRGLEVRFADAGVHLTIVHDGSSMIVVGDPARLASVLTNVLTNALKYSPPGGVVTVRLSSRQNAGVGEGGTRQITVTDQGPGVPVDYRERIFEKFFRVEHHLGQQDGGGRGTGIGLYLCREVVKAHGGTIVCEAAEGTSGTRFVITLPIGG
jgi:two-component system, NtrC family, sensor histidine kinase KinB